MAIMNHSYISGDIILSITVNGMLPSWQTLPGFNHAYHMASPPADEKFSLKSYIESFTLSKVQHLLVYWPFNVFGPAMQYYTLHQKLR